MTNRTNPRYPCLQVLSFSFKFRLVLGIALLLAVPNLKTRAVQLSAVYFSACQREIGVIVHVDDAETQLLTLGGEIRSIPRYQIIYMANYPVGILPVSRVSNPGVTEIVSLKTIYQDKIVELVQGWMINHSEDKISFLTISGEEMVVDVEDIWNIDFLKPMITGTEINFEKEIEFHYQLVHPYPFMHCKKEALENGTALENLRVIYPQHLLENHVLIKKELDRLSEGYARLRHYDRNRPFYPVPQIYSNLASIGVWATTGSRHGASQNRKNSFLPEITSELSEGPFDFQRILITGVGLMPYSVHEEPQSQIYYHLKSSYVHFSIMFDLNRALLGEEKYHWQPKDMEDHDERWNETQHTVVGFDYGNFAFEFYILDDFQYAASFGDHFFFDKVQLTKGGLFYHDRFVKVAIHHGWALDSKPEAIPASYSNDQPDYIKTAIEEYNRLLALKPDWSTSLDFYRLNLELLTWAELEPMFSLIYRSMDFEMKPSPEGLKEQTAYQKGEFMHQGESFTAALYLNYTLSDQIKFKGYLSLESFSGKGGIDDLNDSISQNYAKAGFSVALSF